jgi:ABC-type multidrug transport system fused ATPase/permease subunit
MEERSFAATVGRCSSVFTQRWFVTRASIGCQKYYSRNKLSRQHYFGQFLFVTGIQMLTITSECACLFFSCRFIFFEQLTLLQVAAPLNWLGSSYRMIQRAFVDMESMVILMKSDPEIKDDADAVDAPEIDRHSLSAAVPEHLRQVHVDFRDVNFSYTANVPVLRNISFRIFTGDSGVSLCFAQMYIAFSFDKLIELF